MTDEHMTTPKGHRSSSIDHWPSSKNPDPDDPFTLNGHEVAVPPEEAEACMIEMTDALILEFSMLGWTPEMIFNMFTKPFYRMPHLILQSRGESFVRSRLAAVLA